MTRRSWLVAALVAAWGGPALAQSATSTDAKVQVPELAAPQRASLAGQLASFALGPAEVARGAFSLRTPMTAPVERGPLLANPFPAYSAEGGASEWGSGWQVGLAITRFRLSGELDFQTDELTGPFGRLVRGADGAWYPAGLASQVRVAWDQVADVITAYLEDGTVMTFGPAGRITVPGRGTYAWQLSEVRSVTDRRTALAWTFNASGRPFLASVSYGGLGDAYQARLDLAYEPVPLPFEDYRSGKLLALDQRVRSVTVRARHAATGAFDERWRWELGYLEEGYGPGFYLTSVQQVFRSGERPPPATYAYHLARTRLTTAALARNTKVDPLLAVRADLLQPTRSATVDENQDGLADLEWSYDQRLYRQTEAGFTAEPLPPAPPGYAVACRRSPSLTNVPRTLAQLRAGVGDDTTFVLDARTNGSGTTTYLTACERSGQAYTISAASPWTVAVPGSWVPGPTVRLVDLDRDHRPDLIRLQAGLYRAVRNTSTGGAKAAAAFSFGAEKTGALTPVFTPDTAWVQDFNGDGIPDLVGRYTSGIVVWFGKGNLEYASPGRVLQFKVGATTLTQLADYAVTFLDANKDGLTDVLLTKTSNNQAALFLNRGTALDWVDVPGLRAVTASTSPPVVADLAGTGNTEVAYTTPGQGWSLALDGPETGLMAMADDGRGALVAFDYARARPAAGARGRPAVLARITVDSSGAGVVTSTYDYASPTMHTVGKFLVGYGEVQRTDPLATAWTQLHNDDQRSGLVLQTSTRDALVDGVEQYTVNGWADATVQGLPWHRLEVTERGWRSTDGRGEPVREVTTVLAWDGERCPSRVQKVGAAGTLVQEKSYAALAAFERSLACLVTRTVETGTHDDATFDFRHETAVARDAAGQVTNVSSVDDAATLVLQDVAYDAWHRPVSLSAPGRGAARVTYATDTGLIEEITSPDGVQARVTARDPITSALLGLRTTRGASTYEQAFEFDGQERLRAASDGLGALQTLTYQYATATSPASIAAETLVDAGGVTRRTRELTTAAGDAIGMATAIPEGWLFSRLTRRSRATGEVVALERPASATLDPAALTYEALLGGADQVSRTVTGAFGVPVDATQALHVGVTRQSSGTLTLFEGRVVRNQRENATYDVTTSEDAAGQVTGRWDEAGTAWTYRWDVAGRLREVTLPDGAHHRADYDGHGRLARVARDGVATLEHGYHPVTGLPIQTRQLAAGGALRRTIDRTHDAAGRVVEERHTSSPGGAALSYRFYFDGATPDAPTRADRSGLLTAVTGPGYEKRLEYRADGKPAKRALTLGTWRRVETSLEYDLAGAVRGHTTQVSVPGAVTPLLTTTHRTTYDASARLHELLLQGSLLARHGYDAQGRATSVSFANGDALTFSHDPLTRRLIGSAQSSGSAYSAMTQRLDARGLVASEDLVVGGLGLTRSFGYSAQRFLAASSDPWTQWGYGFDAAGLPTSITEGGQVTALVRVADRLTAGALVTVFDDLGRTIQRGDLTLEYGPDGQLATARRGAQAWTYLHDEGGQRLLKLAGGAPVAAYTDAGYLDATQLVEPVKVAGRTIGLVRNGRFESVLTDLRGTVMSEADGTARLASPFGRRDVRPAVAQAIDFVERGYDPDLGLVRMGVRDYDPQLNRFTTPDPTFLASPEACRDSPVQCNLYGYAGGNPLSFVDPTGRYNELIHGVFTYELAKLAGFSENDAARIAIGAASVDHNPETAPLNPPNWVNGNANEWHFNPKAPGNFERAVATNPGGDLFAFGQLFHAAQDWGFHDRGPHERFQSVIPGHPVRIMERGLIPSWIGSHVTDTPSRNPERFRLEASGMLVALVKLAQARGTGPKDPDILQKFDAMVNLYLGFTEDTQEAVDRYFDTRPPGMSKSYNEQLPEVLKGIPYAWSPAQTDRQLY